jgi:hypothetical protein
MILTSRVMFRKKGSLALFFCLVMVAAAFYLNIYLQAARLRAAEFDLTRAMSAQIQNCLASYDEACRAFGLFAFQADAPDAKLFAACLSPNFPVSNISLVPQDPLGGSVVLKNQIIRGMKSRVPAVLLSQLLERMECFGQFFGQPQRQSADAVDLAAGIHSPGQTSSSLSPLISRFFGDLEAIDVRSAAGAIFGDILDQYKDRLIQSLESTYRQYAAECLGSSSGDSLQAIFGEMPDFLDPASISRIAGKLETILTFKTAPVYDKICLVEYILGYFRPAVQRMVLPHGITPLRMIGGTLFETLPDTRESEAEQILTGQSTPDTACRITRIIVTSFRSLIHLAALLGDEKQMASLRATAAAVSAGAAVLSGGTVVIDPEAMLYLVIAGKAIESGSKDYRNLAEGRAVGLWPGQPNEIIALYYQDYLRILLHIIPQSVLVTRIAKQLDQILPGQLYTGLQITAKFRGRTYRLSGGYNRESSLSD